MLFKKWKILKVIIIKNKINIKIYTYKGTNNQI